MARFLAVVGILAVALAAWLLRRDPSPTPTPGNHPPAIEAPSGSGVPAPVVDKVPAPVTKPPAPEPAPAPAKAADQPDWIAFPDGTSLPPLNGVTKAPKLTWHRMLPYTKVVGKERDAQGREWYVHENGARSTTYIDARGQAVGELSMPSATKPILDEGAAK